MQPPRGAAQTSGPQEARQRLYDIEFSTYFGSSGSDLLRDMTADTEGTVYIAGIAGTGDLPRPPGSLPGQSEGGGAMLARFDPAGKLLWCRGLAGQMLYSVEVDGAG